MARWGRADLSSKTAQASMQIWARTTTASFSPPRLSRIIIRTAQSACSSTASHPKQQSWISPPLTRTAICILPSVGDINQKPPAQPEAFCLCVYFAVVDDDLLALGASVCFHGAAGKRAAAGRKLDGAIIQRRKSGHRAFLLRPVHSVNALLNISQCHFGIAIRAFHVGSSPFCLYNGLK